MDQLVSILIPAYNADKWIGETIQSALNQTWPHIEIIIVDDGSKDKTLAVARTFESGNVKVVSQENKGASAARNHALSLAQGDYMQWLDSDDLLAPDKIERQLSAGTAEKNSGVLLYSAFGEFLYRLKKAKLEPLPLWRDLMPIDWILIKFTENTWMNPAAWLVRRELTDKAGPWNEKLTLDDDGEYFCRVVMNSNEIKFVPESKSYYRRANIGSLSRGTSMKACNSLFLSLTLCIDYLLNLENSERTRTACVMYLQNWYYYFYPEKQELVGKIDALAASLGGRLSPPSLSWKYSLVLNLFGWQTTKRMIEVARLSRFWAQIQKDRLLYNIDNHLGT